MEEIEQQGAAPEAAATTPEPGNGSEPTSEPSHEEAPQQVPYDRFSQVTKRAQELERENQMLRSQALNNYPNVASQAVSRPPVPQVPVFDNETDTGIVNLVARQFAPVIGGLTQENQQLWARDVVRECRSQIPDFGQYETEAVSRAQRLGLFQGVGRDTDKAVEITKTLVAAIKAEQGIFAKEAKAQEQRQQQQRAAATAPTGHADRASEKPKSWDKMTFAERKAARQQIKRGK